MQKQLFSTKYLAMVVNFSIFTSMQAKEPFVEYVANPQVLSISVLKNEVMEILQNFAKMNLIRINDDCTVDEPNKDTMNAVNRVNKRIGLKKMSLSEFEKMLDE